MNPEAQFAQLDKHPAWQHAVGLFRKEGFAADQIIPHEWFTKALKLEMMPEKKREFVRLYGMEKIKETLLFEDQVYLVSVWGAGYRVVPPGDQTAVAMQKLTRILGRAISATWNAITNVQSDQLTQQQRDENMQARSKIAFVNGLARKRLKIGFLES
jgi:hypothetical protein